MKFRNCILLYELLLLLTCSGNWMWNWCNSMTAFCVKLYCDKKTMTYYFPYLKEKYFPLYCFSFGKFFNCTFYFTNSCIFHKENVVVIIMFDVSVLHFSLFSVNLSYISNFYCEFYLEVTIFVYTDLLQCYPEYALSTRISLAL